MNCCKCIIYKMRQEYFMTFSEMDVVRYVFLRWISSHKATIELMLVAFSEPNDLSFWTGNQKTPYLPSLTLYAS